VLERRKHEEREGQEMGSDLRIFSFSLLEDLRGQCISSLSNPPPLPLLPLILRLIPARESEVSLPLLSLAPAHARGHGASLLLPSWLAHVHAHACGRVPPPRVSQPFLPGRYIPVPSFLADA